MTEKLRKVVAGSGGGGGGASMGKGAKLAGAEPREPNVDPDNLDSRQYVTLLDVISEGEIQGLKNGLQSIFLDNTPLQNPDGSRNFQNIQIDNRNGTQDQSYIPLVSQVEDEKPVGLTILKGTPITRTITDENVDAVRITISVPQLQWVQQDGDIRGTSIQLQVKVQYNGGGYITAINDRISGRTTDLYQRDYRVALSGPFPVDIRVERLTDDSTDPQKVDAFGWTSYTEITYAKLRYPNTALVAIRGDAEQFSRVPERSYLVRGIKVRIPNNATVDQTNGRLVYSGVWNGTFGAAQWCTDPAWILWDILTSTRYGTGDHIQASQLDKWAFFAASQYASELVPNGFGGVEPRFSCNVNIQSPTEVYSLINDMCSIFRAMPYWSTGALTIAQDRPTDPSYLFTLANVTEEGFSYAGSSLKGRPTVAIVSYLDIPSRDIAYEVVEDKAAISKYGVVTTEIKAFACTSRGQAARIGEWLLFSEQYEREVVSFATSVDSGVIVRPGQVIEISDPVKAGQRRGGRISAATTTTVTVDDATGLPASGGALSVVLLTGAVEQRNVVSRTGAVITVSPAFSSAPQSNSVWIYQTSDLQTSQWRVLNVQEQDGSQYAITALEYNASKYSYIERGSALQFRDTTNLNIIPPSPSNLQAEEVFYENNGRALVKLIISWRPVVGVNDYQLWWRFEQGNWSVVNLARVDYELFDIQQGIFEIKVYSIAAALKLSRSPSLLSYQASALATPPENVTGLHLIPSDQASVILTWNRAIALDVLLGGKVLIRHQNVLTGAEWQNAQTIVEAAAGSQTQKLVPLLEGSYLVKFEDSSGNKSVAPAIITVKLPTPQPRLLFKTYAEDQEDPPFSGNPTDMYYFPDADGLLISSGEFVDDMAIDGDWDALASIDSVGGVLPTGEYEFGSTWDMGRIFDVNLQRRFVTRPYLPAALWDDKVELIDDWPAIDDNDLDRVDAQLQVRTTNDDPGASPTWSEWIPFVNGILQARAFQFKLVAFSADPGINIVIDELGASMELQQRVEQSGIITSAAGSAVVNFTYPFYQAPSVGLTAFNMNSGDYFSISSVTDTGFTLVFRNSAGTAISRNFTYTAIGFGKGL